MDRDDHRAPHIQRHQLVRDMNGQVKSLNSNHDSAYVSGSFSYGCAAPWEDHQLMAPTFRPGANTHL